MIGKRIVLGVLLLMNLTFGAKYCVFDVYKLKDNRFGIIIFKSFIWGGISSIIYWLLGFERVSNQLIRPTRQRTYRRQVDKFRTVGYRPVYKLNRFQSCSRADIVSLFVLI